MNSLSINPRKSIRRSRVISSLPLVALALAFACLALSQTAQAQDGDELNGNTAEGAGALHTYIMNATAASDNTAIGNNALFSDTSGISNTAIGVSALVDNTTGNSNTATGSGALSSNTTGSYNTATGWSALGFNSGDANTATGYQALIFNKGTENTATGYDALFSNSTGGDNTATGIEALQKNTTGSSNTANGTFSLFNNTAGSFNTASGENALRNDTGSSNTAMGIQALNNNTSGSNNTALGALAGQNLTTGNNNIDIGNLGKAGESNIIRIGTKGTQTSTFIAGISGKTVSNGVAVFINANGQLGTVQSSARFKDDIKPMDSASEAVLKLKPVTFHYKQELDSEKVPQFGLIAEDVEKVNPDLVVRDDDGKVTTVRYDAVNAMLLNEFLKEHRKAQLQDQKVRELEAKLAKQDKQIETLTSGLRQVTERVELNGAPHWVADR